MDLIEGKMSKETEMMWIEKRLTSFQFLPLLPDKDKKAYVANSE